MKQSVMFGVFAIITILLMDWIWFSYIAPSYLYKTTLQNLTGSPTISINLPGAILTYMLLVLGLYWFVYRNNLEGNGSLIFNAALFGLVVYGVYNATNYATLSGKYPLTLAFTDTCWGICVCVVASIVSKYLVDG
jgi:uncharacterized membrane protein